MSQIEIVAFNLPQTFHPNFQIVRTRKGRAGMMPAVWCFRALSADR